MLIVRLIDDDDRPRFRLESVGASVEWVPTPEMWIELLAFALAAEMPLTEIVRLAVDDVIEEVLEGAGLVH